MVDHPDEFFTGMRDHNAVVLDFAAFLGKIFGKGIIPMTDIFLGKKLKCILARDAPPAPDIHSQQITI